LVGVLPPREPGKFIGGTTGHSRSNDIAVRFLVANAVRNQPGNVSECTGASSAHPQGGPRSPASCTHARGTSHHASGTTAARCPFGPHRCAREEQVASHVSRDPRRIDQSELAPDRCCWLKMRTITPLQNSAPKNCGLQNCALDHWSGDGTHLLNPKVRCPMIGKPFERNATVKSSRVCSERQTSNERKQLNTKGLLQNASRTVLP
jgi:hypothetical protein